MHEDYEETLPQSNQHKPSVLVTLLVFMAAIALVRYVMPPLVEEVHYSIERGKQRAQFEIATDKLEGDPLAQLSTASRLVNHKIAPSVVHIDTHRETTIETESPQGQAEVQGQGSGVIISDEGEIITNYHVVRGAERIIVTLGDDRQIEASVKGVDRITDLALLQIEPLANLQPATWGDSDELQEGAMVWAVGSPFGLSKTITFGILSAKERRSYDRGQYHEFLQSDAAVSAGNSGGPLVNSHGDVVGINTAIIGPTYQGISFAIPSNRAKQIYNDVLTKDQEPQLPFLGVRLADGKPKIRGFVETSFVESPAKLAGLKKDDVISKWNGEVVGTQRKLQRLISSTTIGADVTLEVVRDGAPLSLTVKLAGRPLQL